MPFVVILIGAVLLIVAFRNTHGDLATALETDVPGYFKWASAIAGVGALGYVPGFRTGSRYLLALVIVVLVLNNYRQIIAGFTAIQRPPVASTAAPSPAAAEAAQPGSVPSQASVAGTAGASSQLASNSPVIAGALDPAAFLTAFEHGLGGFGGVA